LKKIPGVCSIMSFISFLYDPVLSTD
jgi:hypothetical protein